MYCLSPGEHFHVITLPPQKSRFSKAFPRPPTMLRSTITTGSYILEKYSRSYPLYVSTQSQSQSQSQDLVAGQPEWQHFANPVISLTLDVKKSMDDSFESVRLRILWNMGTEHDGTPREITMVRTKMAAYMRLLTHIMNVARKTSISCHFLVLILKFTLHKDRLSKPSIEVRSSDFATNIHFLCQLSHQAYA